jgi:hypothetical protein
MAVSEIDIALAVRLADAAGTAIRSALISVARMAWKPRKTNRR